MKVTSANHPAPAATKSQRKTAAAEDRFAAATEAAPTSQQDSPRGSPATAKSAAAHAGKTVPPGLEKVQARLQELAAGNPTRGQSNALSVITRNIARYAEQQAAAETGSASPPPATDETTAPTASTGSAAPDSTTATAPDTATAPSDTPPAGDVATPPITPVATDASAISDTTGDIAANATAATEASDPTAPASGTA